MDGDQQGDRRPPLIDNNLIDSARDIQISAELGIHVVTLYNWTKTWRFPGEVAPASQKDPEGWAATDKFTVVLKSAGLNPQNIISYGPE
ncbi:MAG: hypothetical protein FJ060_13555 [Cyanobacteria bacterium K_Offshore_0m_m2_072]|nr:hypothetical protein [Cyanobacteria bacterium K_Offshore_0m_m2_072]